MIEALFVVALLAAVVPALQLVLGAWVRGPALIVSMPLAAAWATSSSLGVTFLSLPLMAATHGTLNVIGFAVPGVFAWRAAT
jgi:hypothetical protein